LKKSTGIVDGQNPSVSDISTPLWQRRIKGDFKIVLKNLPYPLFAKEGYKGTVVRSMILLRFDRNMQAPLWGYGSAPSGNSRFVTSSKGLKLNLKEAPGLTT